MNMGYCLMSPCVWVTFPWLLWNIISSLLYLLASSSENAKTLPRVSPCWKFVSTFVYLIQFGIIISYIFLWIKFSIMFHVLPGDLHKVGNFAVTQNENICKEMWKSKWIRSTDVGEEIMLFADSCDDHQGLTSHMDFYNHN